MELLFVIASGIIIVAAIVCVVGVIVWLGSYWKG